MVTAVLVAGAVVPILNFSESLSSTPRENFVVEPI